MTKQVSVHYEKCTSPCEHADICYFLNSEHKDEQLSSDEFEILLEKIDNKKVYYSGCSVINTLLEYGRFIHDDEFKFLTISENVYPSLLSFAGDVIKKDVSITVYSLDKLKDEELTDYTKFFLIKDKETFDIAIEVFENLKTNEFKNIHFPIYHKWAEDNQKDLWTLIKFWNSCDKVKYNISLDSCLENYLLNNKCVYAENYIDLRYDGTVRRCPFSNESHDINYNNPDEMFDIPFTPNCIWHKLFYQEE